MKMSDFDLVLKKSIKNEFIVTDVYKDYAWKDGKPTDELKGWKFRTICPSAKYDVTIIKIEGMNTPIKPEDVKDAPVTVRFDGLTFTSYFSSTSGKTEFVGKATGVTRINA